MYAAHSNSSLELASSARPTTSRESRIPQGSNHNVALQPRHCRNDLKTTQDSKFNTRPVLSKPRSAGPVFALLDVRPMIRHS
ncbi:hypothetical protein M407DRAFT_244861 [Tulasnella calospora MUT 4182]|uniref:Uncharacterized protein n=1 Tax=Tulasnella calospora MUT 4182 TaxID=1051891 RepID=A0A0C3QE49_9AGAM|nr:hypothetical protein M407DRAFT_244861 [Tulasnella calospora MUT 4182]